MPVARVALRPRPARPVRTQALFGYGRPLGGPLGTQLVY